MARFRLTLSTSAPDNEPIPELLFETVRDVAAVAAAILGEDVVFDTQTGDRTAGSRGRGVATPGESFDVPPEVDPADDGAAVLDGVAVLDGAGPVRLEDPLVEDV